MNELETKEKLVEIGIIVAAQGIKGELRVNPSSDFPERFLKPGQRWLQYPQKIEPESVELLKGYQIPGKSLFVIKLEGIKDRNQAEALRGCKLLATKGDHLPLEEDEYHVSDLIGLDVYHQETGQKIGIITDVYFAGNDLLEVQLDDLEKKEKPVKTLIPFVKAIVPRVDMEKRRLEINPPQGLLELNQS